jgi:hypothetical protein
MDYAAIDLLTLELLGEISEGSSTYGVEDRAQAIQWAQEQTARLLGLTYCEAPLLVGTFPVATGETVSGVVCPLDVIKITRLEISLIPFLDLDAGEVIVPFNDTMEEPHHALSLDDPLLGVNPGQTVVPYSDVEDIDCGGVTQW